MVGVVGVCRDDGRESLPPERLAQGDEGVEIPERTESGEQDLASGQALPRFFLWKNRAKRLICGAAARARAGRGAEIKGSRPR
jgi:hypothetical protein